MIKVMDEHLGESNFKVNITNGIKEILSRATVVENTRGYLDIEGEEYPTFGLYSSIKSFILFNVDDHLLKEIKSIKTIGNKYTELAVCASASKLIALPEIVSVIFDLKEGINEILGSFSYYLCNNQLPAFNGDSRDNTQNRELIANQCGVSLPVDGFTRNNLASPRSDLRERKGKTETVLLKLSKASLTEVFETPCWTNFKGIFRKSLSDDSKPIFFHALKLHARFLLSSSNVAMLESFINLKVSLLDQFFKGKSKNDLPNFNEGIVLSKLSHIRLLKTMQLIIEFFQDGSKNYVRLPIKLMDEVVESMVSLISFFPDESSTLSPYHILSVLDPKARWMKTCFYYTCVRNIVLKKLSESSKLITYILNRILSWLNRLNVRNKKTAFDGDLDRLISKKHIKFAVFSHSLHFYSYLMYCEKGRNIVWNTDGGATSQEILKSIVTYLNGSSSCQTAVLLQTLLNNLLINPKNGVISNTLIKILIVSPFFQACQEITLDHNSKKIPMIKPFVIDLVITMLKSKIGRDKFLFCQKCNFGVDYIEMCPARIFLLYVSNLLKKSSVDGSVLLKSLLMSCALLSLSPKGLVEIEESNLIRALALLYRQLKGKNNNDDAHNISSYSCLTAEENDLLDMVTTCLISYTANSGRVWLIEREGILLSILNDCYKQPIIPWGCCWFKKLVVSSTLMTSGFNALVEEEVQCSPLANFWKSRSLDGNGAILSDKATEENSQHELNNFFYLCSTLRGVKALLVEREGSEETLTEGVNPSLSIQEVLEVTLGLNQDSSGQGVLLQDGFKEFGDLDEVFFGLRLLRFMMSSLDTNLLLQNKFLVQEHVMKICNGNMLEGELIVDEMSIICDQILENSCVVDYGNIKNSYQTKNVALKSPGNTQRKSVMTATVPRLEYLSEEWILCGSGHRRSHSRHTPRRLKNDLVKFLGSTRHGLRDVNWLNQLRKVYRSVFIGNNSPEVKSNVLIELVEEVQKAYANVSCTSRSSKFQWSERDLCSLFPEDLLGIKLTVRYGAKLSLLQPTPLVHSNFAHVLRSTYGALKVVRDEFWGFDWFLATVFLLCCGNVDRCLLFINNFMKLQVAPFLWMTYGEFLSNLDSFGTNYRNDFLFLFIQQVELILSIEVPKVFAAFQSSAASVAVLIQQWMCQCFWNILEWSEIKNFLCIAIINEPDYIVYFCVAILLHLQPLILHTVSTSAEHFWEQIKINPVNHFHLGNYLFFIEKLYKIHHNSVIRTMSKCTAELNKSQ